MSLLDRMKGGSLGARAARSSLVTVGGFATAQFLRLLSNLILTRLLFPEAFGLMAIVWMVLQGLNNFSDVGTTPAILRSKRGDDPDFLNTAWSVNIVRGIVLWGVACLLAIPLAAFYGDDRLLTILPVTALSLVLMGFFPTRLDTANRHLNLGRVTLIEIVAQAGGMLVAIFLAWWWQSVWALAISGIANTAFMLTLAHLFLPGRANRPRWDKSALRELVSFGKWIFLATVCGFFISQGDKIVLGKVLPLDTFGVYNIGFFLASVPMLLGGLVTRKVLIPIYREAPPGASVENFAKLRRMRGLVTAFLVAMVLVFAGIGVWLVDVLYDPRYQLAGGVVVLLALMQLPQIIVLTYDQAALAEGDSRSFFVLALARAVLLMTSLVVGFWLGGLFGAILGVGVAFAAAYPVVVWLARRAQAWDPVHDAVFAALALMGALVVIWVNWPAVEALMIG